MKKDIQLKTTESVRINSESVEKVKAAKRVTGVAIGAFIEKAIDKEFERLPKSVKEKINNNEF